MRVNFDRNLNLMRARQQEADNDQCCEKRKDPVNQFLQRCLPLFKWAGIIPQNGLDRHNARMTTSKDAALPIGVFDSGVGGLTVLKAIREALPREDIVYLGDTARLPYGTKSPTSIARYATRATARLNDEPIKLLVVACNTASAVALEVLREALDPIPVVGVVDPGAMAAVAARPSGAHLVLATEATVRLGAYGKAIAALDSGATVREHACELLVALAEEGWTNGDIAHATVRRYLDESSTDGFKPDTIILGCTHFPLLRDVIATSAGPNVAVVDSASTTAQVVRQALQDAGALNNREDDGQLTLMATDGVTRFARVGGQFLGEPLTAHDVQLIDL